MKPSTKTFIFFFVIFYITWAVRATVFYNLVDLPIQDENVRLVFSNIVKLLLWVIPAVVYVVWLERADPLKALKITTPINKHGLALGAVASLLYFVVVVVSEKFNSGRTLAPLLQASASMWLVKLAQVFFSPIFEEIMFRGFVLPRLGEQMKFLEANLLQAVLFTAMHWPNWITVNGLQIGLVAMSVSILVIGLLLGWVAQRANSIWPSVVVHTINNFLVAFLG